MGEDLKPASQEPHAVWPDSPQAQSHLCACIPAPAWAAELQQTPRGSPVNIALNQPEKVDGALAKTKPENV